MVLADIMFCRPLSSLQQKFPLCLKPVFKFVARFEPLTFSLFIGKFSNPGFTICKIYRIAGLFGGLSIAFLTIAVIFIHLDIVKSIDGLKPLKTQD